MQPLVATGFPSQVPARPEYGPNTTNMPKRASRHHAIRASRASLVSGCGGDSAGLPSGFGIGSSTAETVVHNDRANAVRVIDDRVKALRVIGLLLMVFRISW